MQSKVKESVKIEEKKNVCVFFIHKENPNGDVHVLQIIILVRF